MENQTLLSHHQYELQAWLTAQAWLTQQLQQELPRRIQAPLRFQDLHPRRFINYLRDKYIANRLYHFLLLPTADDGQWVRHQFPDFYQKFLDSCQSPPRPLRLTNQATENTHPIQVGPWFIGTGRTKSPIVWP